MFWFWSPRWHPRRAQSSLEYNVKAALLLNFARGAAVVRNVGPHTVTIGESHRFEELGGAVSFVLEGGRVRFNVNLKPVERRGIRISARMLKLASRVDRARPEK